MGQDPRIHLNGPCYTPENRGTDLKSSLPQCYRDPGIKITHAHTLKSRLRASQSRLQSDLTSKTLCADSGKQVDGDFS